MSVATPRESVRLVAAGPYTMLAAPGMQTAGEVGHPQLPCKTVTVLVPPGHRVVGVEAAGTSEVLADGVLVMPAQPVTPRSAPPVAFVPPDADAYAAAGPIPGDLATQGTSGTARGHWLLAVRVHPIRYRPAARQLVLVPALTVTVRLETVAAAQATPGVPAPAFDAMLHGLIANPEQLAMPTAAHAPVTSAATSAVADYIIITNADLASPFQRLATHRASATGGGYTTAVITTQRIGDEYQGPDLQAKIRACIRDQVANGGTTFVCLGGSDQIVPDRDCYVIAGSLSTDSMPTDLYYASCNEGTWDADGDGVYGEAFFDDELDLQPDCILGRITVETAAQADAYIDKLIAYESDLTGYETRCGRQYLMGGKKLWDKPDWDYTGDDEIDDDHPLFDTHDTSDAERWARRTFRDYIQPQWQPRLIRCLFDSLTSWDSGDAGSYPASASNYLQRVAEDDGYALTWIDTHGSKNRATMEDNSFDGGTVRPRRP